MYYSPYVCVCVCVCQHKKLCRCAAAATLSYLSNLCSFFFNFSTRWQGRFWLRSNIYTGLQSQVCPYQTDTWPNAACCCVSAAFRSACSLAWRKISYAAVLAKKMLLLTTLVNIGANESAATARRASECEREGAAAACDERRCCCPPATAAAVKCCKAVAPCWCSWRPTVLPEFQNFQQKPD